MGFKGLIKATSAANRRQQRKDFELLQKLAGCELAAPDWSKTVKAIDKLLASLADENGFDVKDFFGKG